MWEKIMEMLALLSSFIGIGFGALTHNDSMITNGLIFFAIYYIHKFRPKR